MSEQILDSAAVIDQVDNFVVISMMCRLLDTLSY